MPMNPHDPRDRDIIQHYERFLGRVNHIHDYDYMPRKVPRPLFVAEFEPDGLTPRWTYG